MQKPDQKQFDALVAPHLKDLYRVAYRLVRNAPDAQDLLQDTCVAACAHIDALAAADSPRRWLLRVQYNRFVDMHRHRDTSAIVEARDPEDLDAMASQLPDPEQLIQQFQSEHRFEQAFLQLNELSRTLLTLRAEGYELPEIEAITGIDRSVLSARLHRARLRLAQLVAEGDSQIGKDRYKGNAG